LTGQPAVDEFVDHLPVPPERNRRVLVRVREGGRLKPLAYLLDGEEC
jgi:hypothetical protein